MGATNANSLITVAVSKKDEKTYSKTLLLATNRILDTRLNPSTGLAEFWYQQEEFDLKHPAVYYTCTSYTERNLLWAINRADVNQPRFKVHVMRSRKSGHAEIIVDRMFTVNIDQIVVAYDKSDGLGCYMWITRGSDVYRWELSHVVADLIRASSKSASPFFSLNSFLFFL